MKTAVKTPWGVFFFKRLAIGLASAAQSFQRLLNHILDGMDNVFCYVDDIMAYTETEEEHIKVVEELFRRLQNAGLSISLDKCKFQKSDIDYLGYNVSKDGIRPLGRKVEAIQKLPTPTEQKELLLALFRGGQLLQSQPR